MDGYFIFQTPNGVVNRNHHHQTNMFKVPYLVLDLTTWQVVENGVFDADDSDDIDALQQCVHAQRTVLGDKTYDPVQAYIVGHFYNNLPSGSIH